MHDAVSAGAGPVGLFLADGTRLGALLRDGQGVALGYAAVLVRQQFAWASGHGSFEDALSRWF
ncbi:MULTISPECIES: hypothetical protein [Amycolatopsis]|uniref:Uncharacterized protein n=1 Tax=Amycolatopsis dendrobii TaxID=2760662 RepID=A0A7W3Z998_9PSEU|nr:MULTISPECIES: hypothetical protein [Amycolatopsis]MBB1153161.1 hypothetical protein [Amycolatopsis dendrobii]UKD53858.1 hypothetical protein L3Q65_39200 [Amycolatopsis sp. FU40]